MREIMLVMAILISSAVSAENFTIEVGLASFHPFDPSPAQPWNSNNQFIGVQVGNVQFATFLNSYHGWTVYGEDFNGRSFAVGYSYPFNDNFSLDLGLINGYGETVKYIETPLKVGDNLMYVAPVVTVWGSDLNRLGVGHPWLNNIGLKFRAFGVVPVISAVVRF